MVPVSGPQSVRLEAAWHALRTPGADRLRVAVAFTAAPRAPLLEPLLVAMEEAVGVVAQWDEAVAALTELLLELVSAAEQAAAEAAAAADMRRRAEAAAAAGSTSSPAERARRAVKTGGGSRARDNEKARVPPSLDCTPPPAREDGEKPTAGGGAGSGAGSGAGGGPDAPAAVGTVGGAAAAFAATALRSSALMPPPVAVGPWAEWMPAEVVHLPSPPAAADADADANEADSRPAAAGDRAGAAGSAASDSPPPSIAAAFVALWLEPAHPDPAAARARVLARTLTALVLQAAWLADYMWACFDEHLAIGGAFFATSMRQQVWQQWCVFAVRCVGCATAIQ